MFPGHTFLRQPPISALGADSSASHSNLWPIVLRLFGGFSKCRRPRSICRGGIDHWKDAPRARGVRGCAPLEKAAWPDAKAPGPGWGLERRPCVRSRRLRPAHSLRIAQSAVPATYHNPDCAKPRGRARSTRPGTRRSAGAAGAELRPQAGQTIVPRCRKAVSVWRAFGPTIRKRLEVACRRHLRSRDSSLGSGAYQMWKGSGWALDQP